MDANTERDLSRAAVIAADVTAPTAIAAPTMLMPAAVLSAAEGVIMLGVALRMLLFSGKSDRTAEQSERERAL